MAISVKLDDELKSRIQRLADIRHRSSHWIMREAIRDYVEREEKRESFKQDALHAWATYQSNGLHLTLEEAKEHFAAAKVMKKHGIPINDLHSVVTQWDGYAEWKKGDDVHFPGAVYAQLAEQIAEVISAELKANETGRSSRKAR